MADETLQDATQLRRVLDAALALTRAAANSAPAVIADTTLGCALDLVSADAAAFFVVDPLTDEAVRLAHRRREPVQPARFPPGIGAVGWAVAQRAPLIISDARRDARYLPIRSPSPRSLIVAPLEWEGRVIGALSCTSVAADAFSPLDLETLRLFAEHVAAAFTLAGGSRQRVVDESGMVPSRVLAEYAHEIRGPLHTALGFLTLALQDAMPDPTEAMQQARLACQQAIELADAVLDSAAEERQALASVPVSRPTDLVELLRGCVARLSGGAELRGVQIEPVLPTQPCIVDSARKPLERLVDNLLLNAVEHSPDQHSVLVRLEGQGDRAVLLVEDDGPGIPEKDLEKIFTPFYRATGNRPDRSGGLGLALARRWAVQGGGRLWAENRASGGARFVLHLPLRGTNPSLATDSPLPVADED